MLNTFPSNSIGGSDSFVSADSSGDFIFWPRQIQSRPSISVGTDSIYFVRPGGEATPANFIVSYNSSGALNWSVSRSDISGTANIICWAFDSVNQLCYVCYEDTGTPDQLILVSVNLVTGVLSGIIGQMAVTGLASTANTVRAGRVDVDNGRIHWLGIVSGSDMTYIIQNIDGSEFSQTAIPFSGASDAAGNSSCAYITSDFSYAITNLTLTTTTGLGRLSILDLNTLDTTGLLQIQASVNASNQLVGLLDYDGFAVGSQTSTGSANQGDTVKYSDLALTNAVKSMAARVRLG